MIQKKGDTTIRSLSLSRIRDVIVCLPRWLLLLLFTSWPASLPSSGTRTWSRCMSTSTPKICLATSWTMPSRKGPRPCRWL